MRNVFIITALLVLTITLNAQQSSLRADANSPVEAEIKALEIKLADLIVRGEWEEYAKYLASDYLQTRENGQVENRDEALTSLRDIKRKIIVMELEPANLAIRVYGDTAISNAEFTVRVRDSGQVKGRRTRQTNIFVKHEGQWYLVAQQNTTIGK